MLLCPRDSPCKNAGVGCHPLLRGCAGSSLRHEGCLWLWRAGRSRRGAWASPAAEHGLWGGGLPQTQALGSRAQAPQLWSLGLAGPQHVGSSHIRDRACDSCTDRQIPIFSTTRDVPYLTTTRDVP